MLTSMIKRVDNAAYDTFKAKMDGSWKPGVVSLGLAEKGVGWAVDENNEALVKPYMEKMAEIEKGIVDGSIKVHDYMTDNKCEY